MTDAFRQIELFEARCFVEQRLAKFGLRLDIHPNTRARYMVVSTTHNFVILRDLTLRQVAEYAERLEKNSCPVSFSDGGSSEGEGADE